MSSPAEQAVSWKCHECPTGGIEPTFDDADRASYEHTKARHPRGGGADYGIVDAAVMEQTGSGVSR